MSRKSITGVTDYINYEHTPTILHNVILISAIEKIPFNSKRKISNFFFYGGNEKKCTRKYVYLHRSLDGEPLLKWKIVQSKYTQLVEK
jgi:hypothetical protein